MSFTAQTPVRFAHCDGAGIVFYPRYFEMINAAVEDWFAESIGVDFATLHQARRLGIPTIKLDCEFVAPGELGELLDISITTTRLGKSSCGVDYRIAHGDQVKVRASAVLVCMDLDAQKAAPWPADIRAKLEAGLAVSA
jgi:4-hydroxybenzoyl-CoA thioesterase